MQTQKLIINSNEIKSRALYIINNLDIDKPKEVLIHEYKADRSASQNSLMWKWLTIIGSELGESKDDVHERYKGKFLVHIYERDDIEYAETISSLRKLYLQDKAVGADLFKKVVKLTSTTRANVKQMTEYLNDIELDARSLNINLPHPEDQYLLAMGV